MTLETIKQTTDLSASYLQSQRFRKNLWAINCCRILKKILSKFQCGFRKGFSTQHYLLLMLEKWKNAVDNKKIFGALLTDLSKAFDCICHELLIAKLNAYGLSLPALKLVHNYLQNRKHRKKNGTAYSLWEEIFLGVPQGWKQTSTSVIYFLVPLMRSTSKYHPPPPPQNYP